jgi:hypothetical protein
MSEGGALPEGWEEMVDASGRPYFVDHINRKTQWERPAMETIVEEGLQDRVDSSETLESSEVEDFIPGYKDRAGG